jgi:ATP-binding cassette subfamily F protein uup
VLVLDEPTNDLDLETLELLEQRLVDFQGTVLVVSHDREFLDNVVTSVIAFEPEGVREYVGGYSDWLRQRRGVGVPKKPPGAPSKKLTTVSDVPGTKTQKLSYKDKRELEKLPARIESLEAEVAALHELMGNASFYRRSAEEIASTQKSLQELETRVATAYSRWQKLEQSVP